VKRSGSGMFCIIQSSGVGDAGAIISGLMALIAVGFEVAIISRMFRNYRGFRSSGVNMNFLVRIGVFTFVAVLAVGVAFVFVAHLQSSAPNLFLAILPTAAWVIFGTQTDLLEALMFWRDPPRNASSGLERVASTTSSHSTKPSEGEKDGERITLD